MPNGMHDNPGRVRPIEDHTRLGFCHRPADALLADMRGVAGPARRPDFFAKNMFVEGVRLFMVVLGTAAGYWVSRSFGAGGTGLEGLGGMIGCLAGYVSGQTLIVDGQF